MIPISEIRFNDKNPRHISEAKVEKLKKSIKDFPAMMSLRPMVVDADNVVLGGNMRLKALHELGFKEVPEDWIKRADELTEEEKSRFIIADNLSFGEWDWDVLANEWEAADLAEWGMDLPTEWGALNGEVQEDDYEIPDIIHTDIVLGDLFEIGPHRLLCGDSTNADDVGKLMCGEEAMLMVTDPPYGVDYIGCTTEALTIKNDSLSEDETHQLWRDCISAIYPFMKAGGAVYATVPPGPLHIGFAKVLKDAGMLRQIMVWSKDSLVLGHSDYHYRHEPILYGWKPGEKHYFINDRTKTTVFDVARPKASREHPTMKPVELWAEFISNSSKKDWVVYDPFLGSGTTMVAAHQLSRKCYGMELDPKYCQVVIDRMQKLDPNIEIRINGKA